MAGAFAAMHARTRLAVGTLAAALAIGCGGRIEETDGGARANAEAPAVFPEAVCKKACPEDPEPPAAGVAECLKGEDPSGLGCQAQYVALASCAAAAVVCKEGKLDPNGTATALFARCAPALLRYQTCVTGRADAGR